MEQIKQDIEITFRNGDVITYEEIIGYQLSNSFIDVMVGSKTYIYPQDLINNIVLTVKE